MGQFSNQAVDDEYRALSALPLPEAAVVLDTRQSVDDSIPLLAHLNTELDDLTVEMRSHNVVHWAYLRNCVALLRLDAIPGDLPPQQNTDFVIASPDGQEQAMPGSTLLASVLGSEYIDRVRSARLNAPGSVEPTSGVGGVKQSTVRVFILADMREEVSLTRAAIYAHWLKVWSEQEHGRSRHHRDERIHTIILCLNTCPSYQDILLQTLGQVPDNTVDAIILLQKFTDDDAAVSQAAQLIKMELLLYTLILRWPGILWKCIDDPIEMHPRFIETAKTLPWPTYLIGIAAFEYSARWSARWLDYSVTGNMLKMLNDSEAIEQDRSLLVSNVRKWLDIWQRDLRAIVPEMLIAGIDELQGLAALDGYTRSAMLSRGKLRDAPGKLDTLRANAGAHYTGTQGATLQLAIKNGPSAVLDQLGSHAERAEPVPSDDQDSADEPYRRLIGLKRQLQRFLGLHFKNADGAVPRGIIQLAALQIQVQQTIYAAAQKELKLRDYQQQFEQEAQKASEEIESNFITWNLPVVGRVFRSTVISWMVALASIVFLLSIISWQTLLGWLPFAFLSSPLFFFIVWIVRVIIGLLVLAGLWLYLSWRNRSMRRRCREVERRLDGIIGQHLAAAGEVIAARVGLALLQQADLFVPGKTSSPYEERLQAFMQAIRRAELHVQRQLALAETRLGVDIGEHSPPSPLEGPPNRHTHIDLIDRPRLEEIFLASRQTLPANPTINMLVEMLLRQLGSERPHVMLDDIWQQQRWIKGRDKEARFQTIGALLVALLLAASVAQPQLDDMLSALQEYTTMKKLYLEERSMPRGEAIELQTVVKSAMLARARNGQRAVAAKYGEQQGMNALISWVNAQHEGTPELKEIFAVRDLLEQLMLSQMQPSLVIDALYDKATLLGYPDEISGEDFYYLFVAQGGEATQAVFMEALAKIDHRRLQVVAFPDREKLIYLRIHRVRQFFSQEDSEAGESRNNSDTQIAVQSNVETGHQEE